MSDRWGPFVSIPTAPKGMPAAHTHVLPNVCPYCGRFNELTTHVKEEEAPRPGDTSVCFGCENVMEFYEEGLLLGVRKLDVSQLSAVEQAEITKLQAVMRMAKQKR